MITEMGFEASERIEALSLNKGLKNYRLSTTLLGSVIMIKVLLASGVVLDTFSQWLGIVILIVGAGVLANKSASKSTKSKVGQFIQWNTSNLELQLEGDKEIRSVNYADVSGISIALDLITIKKNTGEEIVLNIEGFKAYEQRLRVKANFERLKKYL